LDAGRRVARVISIVTGAAGFIGSHLCQAVLDSGHLVVGIDSFTDYYSRALKEQHLAPFLHHARFSFEERDLSESRFAIPSRTDVMFHLAAQPGVRPSWGNEFSQYLQNNVAATRSLLEAVRREPVGKLIYASSSSVYGGRAGRLLETAAPEPLTPYGVSKLAAEHLCNAYAKSFRIPVVILRLFTVYGPGQRPDMAFSRFIDAAFNEQPIELYGDGRQTRNVTYIRDAVAAMLLVAASPFTNTIFNIAGMDSPSMLDAVEIIGQTLGQKPRIRFADELAGEARASDADITRARSLLQYEPVYSLGEGLREQIIKHYPVSSRSKAATARTDS
jgi:UDP-glucose 4-epimerase